MDRRAWLLRSGGLAAAALVVGCGFELRGSASLPTEMERTRLELSDADSRFARELRLLLEANGVTVVDAAAEDAAVLRVSRERISRRALTVSGKTMAQNLRRPRRAPGST